MAKDAKVHGSDARGSGMSHRDYQALSPEDQRDFIRSKTNPPAHQEGVAAATAPKMTIDAKASTYHPESQSWDIQSRTYQYGGSNRKAAISLGLNKIQGEFPNHKEHEATIREAPFTPSPSYSRTADARPQWGPHGTNRDAWRTRNGV